MIIRTIYSIQLLVIIASSSFCQIDSVAFKTIYIGYSGYFTLPANDSGQISMGPQIISGGFRYKPFGSRLTLSFEVGGDPVKAYLNRQVDTTYTSRLVMATDSSVNIVKSKSIMIGQIAHCYTSAPIRFDFRKMFILFEPGFDFALDYRTRHNMNQYFHYEPWSRTLTEYASDTIETDLTKIDVAPMFRIGFGVYWKQFQISLNHYNFSSIGLSIYYNIRTNRRDQTAN